MKVGMEVGIGRAHQFAGRAARADSGLVTSLENARSVRR